MFGVGRSELLSLGTSEALKHFALLNHILSISGGYLCGPHITIADYYALTVLYLAVCVNAPLGPFPHLSKWFDKMTATKSFLAVYGPLIEWSKSSAVAEQRLAKGMTKEYVSWSQEMAQAAIDALAKSMAADSKSEQKFNTAPPATAAAGARTAKSGGPSNQVRTVVYYSSQRPPSRGVYQFVADMPYGSGGGRLSDLIEFVDVDLSCTENRSASYLSHINVRGKVPALVEYSAADTNKAVFVLNESAAIIRYLSMKYGCDESVGYPTTATAGGRRAAAQRRARTDERISWFNSTFYSMLAFHFVLPQSLRASDWAADPKLAVAEAQWATQWLERELDALEHVWLSHTAPVGAGFTPTAAVAAVTDSKQSGGTSVVESYLIAGTARPGLADYLGFALLSMGGDFIRDALQSEYPDIMRWSAVMTKPAVGSSTPTVPYPYPAAYKPAAPATLPATAAVLVPRSGRFQRRVTISVVGGSKNGDSKLLSALSAHAANVRVIPGAESCSIEYRGGSAYQPKSGGSGSSAIQTVIIVTVWKSRAAWTAFALDDKLTPALRSIESLDLSSAVSEESFLL